MPRNLGTELAQIIDKSKKFSGENVIIDTRLYPDDVAQQVHNLVQNPEFRGQYNLISRENDPSQGLNFFIFSLSGEVKEAFLITRQKQ